MVRQCVDCSNLDFIRLQPTNKVKSFDCGDEDLNDYITNRASLFDQYMLAASYTCIDSDTKLVSRFLLYIHFNPFSKVFERKWNHR